MPRTARSGRFPSDRKGVTGTGNQRGFDQAEDLERVTDERPSPADSGSPDTRDSAVSPQPGGGGRDRRHVLHLIDTPHRRGAELFALDLAARLDAGDAGFRNSVYSLHRPGPGLSLDADAAGRLDGDPGGVSRGPVLDWGLYARLVALVRRLRPDVVLAHGSGTLRYTAALRLTDRRPVLIYRSIGTPSFWARGRMRVAFNRTLLRRMNAVVCVSKSGRDDLLAVYGPQTADVVVIENGVDTEHLTPETDPARVRAVREEMGVPPDVPLIVSVGRVSAEKGHEDLLDLAAALKQSGIDARVLVIGDGPLKEPLEESAAARDLADTVRFRGEHDDVAVMLRAADIFVLPSRTEGMPAALIEAGLCGLAAVSYDVGGVREVIRQGVDGVIVPERNVEALTREVAALIANPARRRLMGAAAREDWQRRFDIRRIAREYESLLCRLLAVRADA